MGFPRIVSPCRMSPSTRRVDRFHVLTLYTGSLRIPRLWKNAGATIFDLGDGILIHGTDNPSSIGKKASHGCIRVAARPLETLWKEVAVGTPVFIFESERDLALASSSGLNDLELTLE